MTSSFMLLPYSVPHGDYSDAFSACWVVWVFRYPPNSDFDHRIFNVRYVVFLHAYARGGPPFKVTSEGRFVE